MNIKFRLVQSEILNFYASHQREKATEKRTGDTKYLCDTAAVAIVLIPNNDNLVRIPGDRIPLAN